MKTPNDNEYLELKGGGGGGDSGDSSASTYTNRPDTLRSSDSFEILLGLGSGRWKGLTNGLKSLYMNDVPLDNSDGTSNFKNITAIFADGDPAQTQTVTFRLGGGGSITSVATVLANSNVDGSAGPWISGATTVPNADAIDFRFVFNQLYHSSPTGVDQATATIEIQMRPQGSSTWYNPLITPSVPNTFNPIWGVIFGTQVATTPTTPAPADYAGGTDTTPSPVPYYPTDGDGGGTYGIYQSGSRFDLPSGVEHPNLDSDVPSMKGANIYIPIDDGTTWTDVPTDPSGYDTPTTGDPAPSPSPSGTYNYLTVTGKTMSTFVKELRISVPKAGAYTNKTWEFRVRLVNQAHQYVNPGTDSQEEYVRSVTLESVTSIIQSVLGFDPAWRGLAWMQIIGQASEQLSGFPSIFGIFDTKMVKVPPTTVFNPDTRVYTGAVWDGSYATSYTNDPAWCIKDLIEDNISGIAAISPGATLDKWDALDASKYFSAMVPDGRGGTQPRFSMNVRLEDETNAQDLVNYMAGAVNALCVDTGGGAWRMKVDKPETPVTTFTIDNIFGDFQYSHTDIDTRYNDITVMFLNEELNYTQDRLRVYDQTHINTYGRKPTTLVAVGCTNRQEALRRAVLRLRTSLNEIKVVKFTTNRQGKFLEPLQTIYIADQSLGYTPPTGSGTLADVDPYDNRTTSRISSMDVTRTQITLGRTVRLEPNVTYKLEVTVPNANYNPSATTQPTSPDWRSPTLVIERTLTNTTAQRGDVNVLYLNSALPSNTPANAVIALSAPGMPTLPVQYRIIDIAPSDGESVAITAIIIDSGKYTAADNATSTDVHAWVTTGRTGGGSSSGTGGGTTGSGGGTTGGGTNYFIPRPTVPTWGMFKFSAYISQGVEHRILTVNWTKPTGNTIISSYSISHGVGRNTWTTRNVGSQTSIEFPDPVPGHHDFKVVAHDLAGATSSPLTGGYDVPDYNVGIGIPHSYGALISRPTTDLITGQLYTATDGYPTHTYRWDGTQWVVVSSSGIDINGGRILSGIGSVGAFDSGDVSPTTILTRATLRTSLGTAAAITGQGALATLNQAAWTTDISGRPANLAALTGLEAIKNADILAVIASDGVLSAAEKRQTLSKRAAEAESAYTQTLARATALGVSTTALTTARTNWLNQLATVGEGLNQFNNATFTRNLLTEWSLSTGTVAVAAGSVQSNQLAVTNTGPGYAYRQFTTVVGGVYRFTGTFVTLAGSGVLKVGTAIGDGTYINQIATGSVDTTFIATTTTTFVSVGDSAGGNVTNIYDSFRFVDTQAQPAWDDFTADSTIQYLWAPVTKVFPANYTGVATYTKRGPYYRVSDTSTSVAQQITTSTTGITPLTVQTQVTACIIVKKDNIPKTTRAPRLRFITGGGSGVDASLVFDTSTGEVNSKDAAGDIIGVFDLGDDWLFYETFVLDIGTANYQLIFHPAYLAGSNLNGATSNAPVGDVDVRNIFVVQGTIDRAGQYALVGQLNAYSAAQQAVLKAITEKGADINGGMTDSGSGTPTALLSRSALLTALGVASAITGQGALATKSTAVWGTDVSGRPTELTDGRVATALTAAGLLQTNIPSALADASNILRRTSGGLFTGDLGADVTATHIASGFTGQGALATKSSVDLTTADVINKSLANLDSTANTKLSGIAAGATVGGTFGIDLLEATGGATATLANFKTSSGTAAAITGQGALATVNSADWSTQVAGAAKPADNATVGGIFNTNVYRSNGSTLVTDSTAITSLGTAAAITGQGALATKSSVDPSTSDVLTTGSIPPSILSASFTTSTATTSITINWSAMTLYRADGTTMSISSGSRAITGLTLGTTYRVYPYVTDNGGSSGSVSWVTTGTSSPVGSPATCFPAAGDAGAAANMLLRSRIPLNSFQISTTTSGTGSGGGGGFACLHPNMPMGAGIAEDLSIGDDIKAPNGTTKITHIARRPWAHWIEVFSNDEMIASVTPDHRFYYARGGEVLAENLKLGDLLESAGNHVEVTGLRLSTEVANVVSIEVEEPHLYYGGKLELKCHNIKGA